jgi:putative chitinase
MQLTIDQLRHIAPNAPKNADVFLPYLNQFCPQYSIDTVERICCFLGNLMEESGQLRYVREIWGPTTQQKKYERDFNAVWPEHDRNGRNWLATQLGNSEPGDGLRFRGHGLIETTGRANHLETSKALFGDDRLLQHPELLEVPEYAVKSACHFWKSRGCNELADQVSISGDPHQNFKYTVKKVNGGLTHYTERLNYYLRAKEVIT